MSSSGTSRHFAALDIGSNSFNLSLVRIREDGQWEMVGRHKETVRLAHDLDADGERLSPEAMDRGVEALGRCLEYARGYDAPVRAVATSAVREARNRQEFLDRVRAAYGLEVEVVSGHEEARLIWMGLQADPTLSQRRAFSFDIGGGSVEFCVGTGEDLQFASSLPLGGVRLAGRFFPDGDVSPKALKQCREWVQGRLEPIVRALRTFRWDLSLATAGTVGALMRMVVMRREGHVPLRLSGSCATGEELLAVCREVCATRSVKARRKLPGMDEKRADILPAGAVVVETLVKSLSLTNLEWRDSGVREGVVRDYLERESHVGKAPELGSWRRRGVTSLADSFSLDRDHDRQVERLSRELFLQLSEPLRLDENAGELLEAAAQLHEVGLRIGFDEHHKHSYYVVRHSHLLAGFVDREIEMIAQVARYHRKSHPKPSHPQWMALSEADRRIVSSLSGLLRVADGLDRRHQGAVAGVKAHRGEGGWVLVVQARSGDETGMEIWAADSKKALLEECLGGPVTLVPAA